MFLKIIWGFKYIVKGFVVVVFNGVIIFVSDLYGGYCSDKIIVEYCGIL